MSSCKSQYYACSRGTKQPWRRAITMRSAESELQNTIELRATASEIAAPKPDLGAKAKQNHNFEAFFTRNFKMKIPAPKLIKSADKSLSQPWCSHSNTIYDVQLQKTLVLRMQPRHQATLMQPLQCVWQHHVANSHVATHMATEHDNNHAAIIMQSATRHSTSALNDAHMNNHSLQNTKGEPIRSRNDRSRARRTQEVPFIAAWPAATLHGKTPGFVLQLPPQHKSHATSCNIHAAITMRFAATPTHPCSHYATICIRSLYSLQHRGGTNSTPKWPPHPPHTGGTFHRRLQPLYTEKRQVSCSSFLPNTGLVQHSCSHYNAYCSNTYTSMQPLHHDLHPLVAEHRGGTDSQRRYLSSPPAATLHGQTQGFVLRFLPNTSSMQHSCSHYNAFCSNTYTSMQPLQCDLHPDVAEHRGETDSTPKRPQPHSQHTGGTFHRRLQPLYTEKRQVSCSSFLPNTSPMQHHATFMQPLQCVLQQHLHNHAATTLRFASARYTRCSTEEEPIRPRNDRRTRRTQEVPFIAACSHFTRKNTRFRAPASSPTQVSCNIHAAITMRFAAAPTHPCSHYTTIYTRSLYSSQNTEGEPIRPRDGRSRTRRTQEVPFIAACSHFTRKNARFPAPTSSPTQIPCNIHAAITMRFAATPTHPCSHYTTISIRSLYSLQHRGGTDSTPKRTHPPQTRGTFHRCLQPLYTEKHKVSWSGFVANTSPMQHLCSHYNAFCSNTYTSMQPLQCVLHPHVAEHQGRSDSTPKRLQSHPPHTGGTFHRRLQPLYTEKHQVSCSGFLPNTNPMQHSCSHYNAFAITKRFAATPTHP